MTSGAYTQAYYFRKNMTVKRVVICGWHPDGLMVEHRPDEDTSECIRLKAPQRWQGEYWSFEFLPDGTLECRPTSKDQPDLLRLYPEFMGVYPQEPMKVSLPSCWDGVEVTAA